MVDFTIEEVINQPKDVVYKAFFNPENMIFWTKDLEKIEIISGNIDESGSKAVLHFIRDGKRYRMEEELIESLPGYKYVTRVSGDYITATLEIILEEADKDTVFKVHYSGKGNSISLKIRLLFKKKKMRQILSNELKTFKELVENRGSEFNIFSHKIS